MKLVVNGKLGHREAIAQVLDGSEKALVAVAFLKDAGAKFLGENLSPILKKGGAAEVIVGTDFFLTTPNALETLLKLSNRYNALEVFIAGRNSSTFHPKLYAGVRASGVRYLVGSANLTGGALDRNVEASLISEGETGSDIEKEIGVMFATLRTDTGRFRGLNDLELAQYRSAWGKVEKERKRFEKAIAAATASQFDLGLLESLYAAFLADPDAQADLASRADKRRLARNVQNSIVALATGKAPTAVAIKQFERHLKDLMSGSGDGRHLWPSDAIYRQGTKAISQPRQMIELFAVAYDAAKQAVPAGYETVRSLALNIKGVGPNMVTEILSTFAPRRYPVVNGNTRAALRHLGLTFPGSLQLKELKPERYAEIRGLIAAVQVRLGAPDFPQTDAFLNWVYQTVVRHL